MAIAIQDSRDGINWTGSKSQTIGPFVLLGGKYSVAWTAADTSAELDIQMPDATYQAVGSSMTSTTALLGPAVVDLPAGSYRIVVVSATNAMAGFVQRIPYLPA